MIHTFTHPSCLRRLNLCQFVCFAETPQRVL
nr:MAG TPA: hypothetical protein [Caudoviricetes sp.]